MPSWQHLLLVLVIVLLVFGTKKIRNIGQDLGGAIKGFKDGMKEANSDKPAEQAEQAPPPPPQQVAGQTIDVEVKEKTKS